MPPRHPRLLVLETLRGLAALSVALLHALGATGRTVAPLAAGVDVFFVVSGFVMVQSSAAWFGVPGARRRFLLHRAARIVPLYWAVTTLLLAVMLLSPGSLHDTPDGWRVIVGSYLFVPVTRADGAALPIFRLGWTLEFEALFYLIFAAALGLSRPRALIAVGVTLAALVVAGTRLALPMPLAVWAQPIVLEFAAGMLLAEAHHRGVMLPRAAMPLLVAGALGLIGMDLTRFGVDRAWAFGPAAAMLVALVLLPPRPAPPARLHPWLAPWRRAPLALGAASYALYCTHLFAVRGVRAMLPVASPLFVPLALAAAVALALAVHAGAERPLLRALRRRIDRPPAHPAAFPPRPRDATPRA